MQFKTGVIDEPIIPGTEDFLGLGLHSRSLIKFIERANTPMTIGIQGEWGSGKTSLMKAIDFYFDEDKSDTIQIWINTWEFSLLSTPEETLINIVSKITEEIIKHDENKVRSNAIRKNSQKLFKSAFKLTASFAGDIARKVSDEIFDNEESISSLKDKLREVVDEIITDPTNEYKRIIIYVDDLDRIVPENAVTILELLKNIFNLNNCIFLLAIDYQVVVKGLRKKFGRPTAENEWEFRAFFDKLIQLPFFMPINQYNIGKYIINLLEGINFIVGTEFNEDELKKIVHLTIGGNPRSIKRLVNSLSLIEIFNETKLELNEDKDNKEYDKFILFSLLCLQIAYPYIYDLISRNPNFVEWNRELAKNITRNKEEKEEGFNEDFENFQQHSEEFIDEEWEQALFRICYLNKRLRSRFQEISQLLNIIKKTINDDNKIEKSIKEIIDLSSVTNVSSFESAEESSSKARQELAGGFEQWCDLRNINDLRDKKELKDFINRIEEQGLLISKYTNSQISFKNNGDGKIVNVIYISKRKGGIQLAFASNEGAENFVEEVEKTFSKEVSVKKNESKGAHNVQLNINFSNLSDNNIFNNILYYIKKYREELLM